MLGGDAYACALPAGGTLVGSTFDDGEDLAPDPEADASNLRRLARMLELDAEALARGAASGPAGHRWTARDRLPLVGALPDEDAARALADELARTDRLPLPRQPGLYTACGFGSRGLLWSVLAAEVLADAIDGGVAPVEADLLDAVDPARFLRQRVRRRRAF
ncbi:MAG: FAD-dependent oxidoreductase [Burkholderiaceae bacterium]